MRVTPSCDPINNFFISTASGIQWWPDITFGGGNYFVVWSDGRSGYYNIYGARVTTAGTVLDPNGILIGTSTTANQYWPSVAFTGTRYFVVWGYASTPYAVTGRFVNTDGTMASDTVRIASAGGYVYGVRHAYDGTNFLVVWSEYNSSTAQYDLRGIRVSGTTGAPLGSPFTIANNIYYYSLSVRFIGTNYLVVYSVSVGGVYQIWGRFYNTLGQPVGSAFRISNSTGHCLFSDFVAGANNRCLTVWSDYRGGSTSEYDIYGNIDVVVGIEEVSSPINEGLKPFTTLIKNGIHLPAGVGEGIIYDVFGRKVGETKGGYFDAQHLTSGVYFVVIDGSDVRSVRVVKIR